MDGDQTATLIWDWTVAVEPCAPLLGAVEPCAPLLGAYEFERMQTATVKNATGDFSTVSWTERVLVVLRNVGTGATSDPRKAGKSDDRLARPDPVPWTGRLIRDRHLRQPSRRS